LTKVATLEYLGPAGVGSRVGRWANAMLSRRVVYSIFVASIIFAAATVHLGDRSSAAPNLSANSPTLGLPSDSELVREARLRKDFGLAGDVAQVAELYKSKAQRPADFEYAWSLLLKRAEFQELTARFNAQSGRKRLADYLETISRDDYAGMYADQHDGRGLVIAITRNRAKHEPMIKSLARDPQRIEIRDARLSLADFDRLMIDVARSGVAVAGWYPDVPRNRAIAWVSDLDGAREMQATHVWDGLEFRQTASVSPTAAAAPMGAHVPNAPPLKGGQAISSGPHVCTAGFINARTDTNAQIPGRYGMFTAGHCTEAANGGWREWSGYPSSGMGTITRSVSNPGYDASQLAIPSGAKVDSVIFRRPDLPDLPLYGNKDCVRCEIQDEPVCQAGAVTQYVCGIVKHPQYPSNLGSQSLLDVAAATFPNQSGDSGGSVFDERNPGALLIGTGHGIVSGGSTDPSDGQQVTVYSWIGSVEIQERGKVMTAMNQIPCTTFASDSRYDDVFGTRSVMCGP
jgi:hypothetical protein